MTKMLPEMTYSDYSAVYNSLSFVMASMGASTIYFFVHIHMVQKQFRTALCITGLVTLIAFYHYFRIFNSWTEAYEFLPLKRLATGEIDPSITDYSPHLTGQPFNDAYRCAVFFPPPPPIYYIISRAPLSSGTWTGC